MGVLKDYLDRAGYPTIWFNAWHHHEETHLFGALLERLRQGLPAPWTPSGMWFHLRLAWIRILKQPVTLALIGGLAIFTVAFLWKDIALVWNFSKDWISRSDPPSWPVEEKWFFLQYTAQIAAELREQTQSDDNSLIDLMLGPFKYPAVFIATLLAALTRGLGTFTSFGFKPKTLFRKVGKAFKTVSFESDPGLRFKLDEDLGDISTALGKKPLTIFIDDMDRCPPERALKVLESVNFLSSSPRRCFIVMCIWLKQTVTSISREFVDFIKEKNPQLEDESDKVYKIRLHALRKDHAKTYPDKMIQIEIAVPKISPEVLANLAKNEEDNEKNQPPKKSLRERWEEYRKADETLKRELYDRPRRFLNEKAFPMIFLLMVLTGGFLLASVSKGIIANSRQEMAQAKIKEIKTEIKTVKTEIKFDQKKTGYAKKEDYLEGLERNIEKLVDAEAQSKEELKQAKTNIEIAFVGGFSIGFFGLVFGLVLSVKRNFQDSKKYRTALNIWAPVMALKEPNPRHLKRLVNLLRLISMRDKDKEKNVETSNTEESQTSDDEMSESEKRAIKFVLLMALEELEVELNEFLELGKGDELKKNVRERFLDIIKIGDRELKNWSGEGLEARKLYWAGKKLEAKKNY